MKVRYIHSSDPDATKIHDTVKARQNNMGLLRLMGDAPSQKAYDAAELSRFERDRQRGIVLSYDVL